MEWLNGENVSMILFFIGIYGLVFRRSIIKSVISIIVMETGVILFFLTINFDGVSHPPIGNEVQAVIADPLPQAFMITAIVIGIAVTAVSLTMANTIHHRYGTSNWKELTSLRKEQN
jgi:multicomponent Na+:H+ antiporter subunit C